MTWGKLPVPSMGTGFPVPAPLAPGPGSIVDDILGFSVKLAVFPAQITEDTKAQPALLHLNILSLDEIAPPVGFGLNVVVETLRRGGSNRQTFDFFEFLERLRLNRFPD